MIYLQNRVLTDLKYLIFGSSKSFLKEIVDSEYFAIEKSVIGIVIGCDLILNVI